MMRFLKMDPFAKHRLLLLLPLFALRCLATSLPPQIDIAHEVTSDIRDLAQSVGNDPMRAYEYVKSRINYRPYFGLRKGANLTLLDQAGNDFDQAALLIALIRACEDANGVDYQVKYWVGEMQIPEAEISNWLGVDNLQIASAVLERNGIPHSVGADAIVCLRAWVSFTTDAGEIQLDPALKPYQKTSGIGKEVLLDWTGYTDGQFSGLFEKDPDSGSLQNVDVPGVEAKMHGYSFNLLNSLRTLSPNASVADLLGERTINVDAISVDFEDPSTEWGQYPILSSEAFESLPQRYGAVLRFEIGYKRADGSFTASQEKLLNFAHLQGKRFGIGFDEFHAKVLLDDEIILKETNESFGISEQYHSGVLTYRLISYPNGLEMDASGNAVSDPVYAWKLQNIRSIERSERYVFTYGAPETQRRKASRIATLLDLYNQGYSYLSDEFVMESYYIRGLDYFYQCFQVDEMTGLLTDEVRIFDYRIGAISRSFGLTLDMFSTYSDYAKSSTLSVSPTEGALVGLSERDYVYNILASSLEHGILEQIDNKYAISTSKVLKSAQSTPYTKREIFKVDSSNFDRITAKLSSEHNIGGLRNLVDDGYSLLLHSGIVESLDDQDKVWRSFGYYGFKPDQSISIVGHRYGGSLTDSTYSLKTAQQSILDTVRFSYGYQSPYDSPSLLDDPVNLSNGAYRTSNVDMRVDGYPELPLEFVRSYNSADRALDRGLGFGWSHNYIIEARVISDASTALGAGSSFPLSNTLSGLLVSMDLLNQSDETENWYLASLAGNYAVDRLSGNSVSIYLGGQLLHFFLLPNGEYLAPGNTTSTLLWENDHFVLKRRNNGDIVFNSDGKAQYIEDSRGKRISFSYDGNGRLIKVTDPFNRNFTFTYGSNDRLKEVTDSTMGSRKIQFAYDNNGNLITYTDPEGKFFRYGYGANPEAHLLRELRSPRAGSSNGQLVLQNSYGEDGVIQEQIFMGDDARKWMFDINGFRNVVTNPMGETTDFYFDTKGRLTAHRNGERETIRIDYDANDRIKTLYGANSREINIGYNDILNAVEWIDSVDSRITYRYTGSNPKPTSIERYDKLEAQSYTTTLTYNGTRLSSVEGPFGNKFQFSYNPSGAHEGLLQKITDPADNYVEFSSFDYGFPKQIKFSNDPLKLKVLEFDQRGDLRESSDIRDSTFKTRFEYDKNRRLTRVTRPDNSEIRYVYDDAGNLAQIIDPEGHSTQFDFDAQRRITAIHSPSSISTVEIDYDVAGRIWKLRDRFDGNFGAINRTSTLSYDSAGRLTEFSNPAGAVWKQDYDNDNLSASIIEPTNVRTTWKYDDSTGIETVTTSGVPSVNYEYKSNALGELKYLKDRNGRTRTLSRGGSDGRTITLKTPLDHEFSYHLHKNGKVESFSKPTNERIDFVYDPKSRLIRADYYDRSGQFDNKVTYVYNGEDKLTLTKRSNDSDIQRDYDTLNRLFLYTDSNGQVIRYDYYPDDKLQKITYPDGFWVSYEYDSNDRLTAITDGWAGQPARRRTTISYSVVNGYRTSTLSRPNGTTRQSQYNGSNKIRQISEKIPKDGMMRDFFTKTFGYGTSSGNVTGQITSQNQTSDFSSIMGLDIREPQISASYDEDNRVVNKADGLFTREGRSNYTINWNPHGNMVDGPSGSMWQDHQTHFSYYTGDRLSKSETTGQTVIYAYDQDNQLKGMSYTDPEDPEGLTIASAYVVDPNGSFPRILMRYKQEQRTHYVYGPGLLYEVKGTGAMNEEVRYYHYDQMGNTLAMTNQLGTITDSFSYSRTGYQLSHHTGSSDTPFRFGGRFGIFTAPNGLLYDGFRHYNPTVASYMTSNPAGVQGYLNNVSYTSGNIPAFDSTRYNTVFDIDYPVAEVFQMEPQFSERNVLPVEHQFDTRASKIVEKINRVTFPKLNLPQLDSIRMPRTKRFPDAMNTRELDKEFIPTNAYNLLPGPSQYAIAIGVRDYDITDELSSLGSIFEHEPDLLYRSVTDWVIGKQLYLSMLPGKSVVPPGDPGDQEPDPENPNRFTPKPEPPIVDNDGDEMDDVWEIMVGLNPTINDAGIDYDDDGLSNKQEYLARTNPFVHNSHASLGGAARTIDSEFNNGKLFCYVIAPGNLLYGVERPTLLLLNAPGNPEPN